MISQVATYYDPCMVYAVCIGIGCILLAYIVIYFIHLVKLRRQVKSYNYFVYEYYTRENESTPILILRIQNHKIRQYNTFCRRGIGRLFRLRQMPEFGNSTLDDVADSFNEHYSIEEGE